MMVPGASDGPARAHRSGIRPLPVAPGQMAGRTSVCTPGGAHPGWRRRRVSAEETMRAAPVPRSTWPAVAPDHFVSNVSGMLTGLGKYRPEVLRKWGR